MKTSTGTRLATWWRASMRRLPQVLEAFAPLAQSADLHGWRLRA